MGDTGSLTLGATLAILLILNYAVIPDTAPCQDSITALIYDYHSVKL